MASAPLRSSLKMKADQLSLSGRGSSWESAPCSSAAAAAGVSGPPFTSEWGAHRCVSAGKDGLGGLPRCLEGLPPSCLARLECLHAQMSPPLAIKHNGQRSHAFGAPIHLAPPPRRRRRSEDKPARTAAGLVKGAGAWVGGRVLPLPLGGDTGGPGGKGGEGAQGASKAPAAPGAQGPAEQPSPPPFFATPTWARPRNLAQVVPLSEQGPPPAGGRRAAAAAAAAVGESISAQGAQRVSSIEAGCLGLGLRLGGWARCRPTAAMGLEGRAALCKGGCGRAPPPLQPLAALHLAMWGT